MALSAPAAPSPLAGSRRPARRTSQRSAAPRRHSGRPVSRRQRLSHRDPLQLVARLSQRADHQHREDECTQRHQQRQADPDLAAHTSALHCSCPASAQQLDRLPPQVGAGRVVQPGRGARRMRQGQDRCVRRALPGQLPAHQIVEPRGGPKAADAPDRRPARPARGASRRISSSGSVPSAPGRRATGASRPMRPAVRPG